MSKFCGNCGKLIPDNAELCPECEIKLADEKTLTLNPAATDTQAEMSQVQSAPAPKPAPARPERPIVTEFPIIRIAPRADAIAKEKSSARNKLLMMAGIALAALLCISLIVFGIYKLATRPSKNTDEPKTNEPVITETLPVEHEPENPPAPDTEDALSSKDPEMPSEQTDAGILQKKEYAPYRNLINDISTYFSNEDANTDSMLFNSIKLLLEENKIMSDSCAYDLVDFTDNKLHELAVFIKSDSEYTGAAPKLLCIVEIDEGEPEIEFLMNNDADCYLSVKDNGKSVTYKIIKHYIDEEGTEKFAVFNSPDDMYDEEVKFDCFVKGDDGVWLFNGTPVTDEQYKNYPLCKFESLNSFEMINSPSDPENTPDMNNSDNPGITTPGTDINDPKDTLGNSADSDDKGTGSLSGNQTPPYDPNNPDSHIDNGNQGSLPHNGNGNNSNVVVTSVIIAQ